jgi:hypothetical protein
MVIHPALENFQAMEPPRMRCLSTSEKTGMHYVMQVSELWQLISLARSAWPRVGKNVHRYVIDNERSEFEYRPGDSVK